MIIVPGNGPSEHQISRSLRCNSADSAYLNRTFSTPTSSSIWTLSLWVKRGLLTGTYRLFGASTSTHFGFNSSDQLNVTLNGVSAATSTAIFRDPTAWMHVVYQQNGSAQTISVNGTSVATGTTAASVFNTAISHQIGAANTSDFFNGYVTEIYFVDGQALTPSSFGQTNITTSAWDPIKYSGSFGTNGFWLSFANNGSTTTLGDDDAGGSAGAGAGSNNWTLNNFSVTAGVGNDSLVDTPTNFGTDTGAGGEVRGNYAIWNSLDESGTVVFYANGNLEVYNAGGTAGQAYSSINITSGKWRMTMHMGTDVSTMYPGFITGIINPAANRHLGQESYTYAYITDGRLYNNNVLTSPGYSSYTANDNIDVLLDADNGKVWFAKNGTVQGAGSPNAGTSAAFTGLTGPYRFAAGMELVSAAAASSANFGQRAYTNTISTASNFQALCTKNISEGSITTSGSFTGNGSANGPVVQLNGVPTTMTINSNSVTFNGTHADKLAGGFKLRTSSSSYNTSGSNTYSVTATGSKFKYARAP